MSTLRNVLNNLFSQTVVLKRMPGDRIKALDFNKIQAIGSEITSKGRYAGVKRTSGAAGGYNNSGYSSAFDISQIDAARQLMYLDYEAMDSDAILSAALDIYADESTVKDPHGDLLKIRCEDDKMKQILHNLYYDILNVEFNLWSWVRSLCKFGDLFLYIPTTPGIGVSGAIPIHASLLKRNDFAGANKDKTEYVYEGTAGYSYNVQKTEFDFHEIAHFRVLADNNYLPYGRSLLEGARKTYKQLMMMEDAMLIHRIMRAPERRIFKIDVGNIPTEQVDTYIESLTNNMKKIPYKDPNTGDYNLHFNLMNMLEDFYLPTRGGVTETEITTLEGLQNDGNLEDIEYLRNKMMAYLKIPKSYLGYDADIQGKGGLAAEDIKFARFIERIQTIITAELTKIAYIHLYYNGYKGEDLLNFSLELSTPSLIYKRQQVDLMNEQLNLVSSILEEKILSRKWIYENIFNMTQEEVEAEMQHITEDQQLAFRLNQMVEEGNDPKVTGEVLGTPASIVAMQNANNETGEENNVSKLFKYDKRQDNQGRPEKAGSFGRERDPSLGKDPTGLKTLQTPLTAGKISKDIFASIESSIIKLNEEIENLDEETKDIP